MSIRMVKAAWHNCYGLRSVIYSVNRGRERVIVSILGGTGEQGPGMALRWARAGVEVIIGSRQQMRAEAIAAELNQELGQSRIKGMANPDAAAAAEVVALTVRSRRIAAPWVVRAQLQGKVLIDVCVAGSENPARC
jgi:predicted dinucleotide-binding enzyme